MTPGLSVRYSRGGNQPRERKQNGAIHQDIPKLAKNYFGFICKNCGLPIVVGELPAEWLDADGGVEIASHKNLGRRFALTAKPKRFIGQKNFNVFRQSKKGNYLKDMSCSSCTQNINENYILKNYGMIPHFAILAGCQPN